MAQALDMRVGDFLWGYLYSWFCSVGPQLLQCTRLLMGLVGNHYVYWDDLHGLSGTSFRDLWSYLVLLYLSLISLSWCPFSLIIPIAGLLLIFYLGSGMVFVLVWQPLSPSGHHSATTRLVSHARVSLPTTFQRKEWPVACQALGQSQYPYM